MLLHGFQKKTRTTPAGELETPVARLRELTSENKWGLTIARTGPFRRRVEEELRDPEFARDYTEELQRLRLA